MRSKSLLLANLLFLLGFGTLLAAPLLGRWLRVPPPQNVADMRTLAEWPAWEPAGWAAWPAKFDTWLNDHYPLRGYIIRVHSLLRHRLLHAPSNNVLVGKSNWLYYTGDRTLEDFVGRDALTATELAQWHAALEGRRAWLQERGIQYLFVVVPNKSTIVPEMMPALLQAQRQNGKLDQLLPYLRVHAPAVQVLDLRATLAAVQRKRDAYWRADSHWSGDGIVAASLAIAARAKDLAPEIAHGDIAGSTTMESAVRDADCIDLLGMREIWPRRPERQVRLTASDFAEGQSPLLESPLWKEAPWWKKPLTSTRASGTGKGVLFSDSFFRVGGLPGDQFGRVPLMLSFHRLTTLWEWASFDQLKAAVDAEKPDIVIEAWTERFLKNIPADHPELARARAAVAR